MRKFILFFVFSVISIFNGLDAIEFMIEGKAAYYHPSATRFHRIYGDAALVGAEITVPMKGNFKLFIEADYFEKEGTVIEGNDRTHIEMIPLNIGVKYFIPSDIDCLDLYIAAGLQNTFVEIHDHSNFVRKHLSENGFGAIFKGGVVYYFSGNFFLDLFVNYATNTIRHSRSFRAGVIPLKANVSGVSAGLGVGYHFGKCCEE